MLSISTDQALQMIQAGWIVEYSPRLDAIRWESPEGISGDDMISESLDDPPPAAVRRAKSRGQIIDRPRGPRPHRGRPLGPGPRSRPR